LGRVRRPAMPLRVVRSCARLDEARAGWAEVTRLAPSVEEKIRIDATQKAWDKMNSEERRAFVEAALEKRTARFEARLTDCGRFTATGSLVQHFRLLLSRDMFDPSRAVEVSWNGKSATYDAKLSKVVLLREFVERFDRTFLPVAEASCP